MEGGGGGIWVSLLDFELPGGLVMRMLCLMASLWCLRISAVFHHKGTSYSHLSWRLRQDVHVWIMVSVVKRAVNLLHQVESMWLGSIC